MTCNKHVQMGESSLPTLTTTALAGGGSGGLESRNRLQQIRAVSLYCSPNPRPSSSLYFPLFSTHRRAAACTRLRARRAAGELCFGGALSSPSRPFLALFFCFSVYLPHHRPSTISEKYEHYTVRGASPEEPRGPRRTESHSWVGSHEAPTGCLLNILPAFVSSPLLILNHGQN